MNSPEQSPKKETRRVFPDEGKKAYRLDIQAIPDLWKRFQEEHPDFQLLDDGADIDHVLAGNRTKLARAKIGREFMAAFLEWLPTKTRGFVEAPCGIGKTNWMLLIAALMPHTKIMIIVPSKALITQTYQRATTPDPKTGKTLLDPDEVGVLYGDKKQYDKRVTIVTRQTYLAKTAQHLALLGLISLDENQQPTSVSQKEYERIMRKPHSDEHGINPRKVMVTLFDEVHSTLGEKTQEILAILAEIEREDKSTPLSLGFTATPSFGTDKNRSVADTMEQMFYIGVREAIDAEVVAPRQVIAVEFELGNTLKNSAPANGIDYTETESGAMLKNAQVAQWLTQTIMSETAHFSTQQEIPFTGLLSLANWNYVNESIAFSNMLNDAWRTHCEQQNLPYQPFAYHIDGQMKADSRTEIIDQLNARGWGILSGADVVVTGIDLPKISAVFRMGATNSPVTEVQVIDRGGRIDPENPTREFLAFCAIYLKNSKPIQQIFYPEIIGGAAIFPEGKTGGNAYISNISRDYELRNDLGTPSPRVSADSWRVMQLASKSTRNKIRDEWDGQWLTLEELAHQLSAGTIAQRKALTTIWNAHHQQNPDAFQSQGAFAFANEETIQSVTDQYRDEYPLEFEIIIDKKTEEEIEQHETSPQPTAPTPPPKIAEKKVPVPKEPKYTRELVTIAPGKEIYGYRNETTGVLYFSVIDSFPGISLAPKIDKIMRITRYHASRIGHISLQDKEQGYTVITPARTTRIIRRGKSILMDQSYIDDFRAKLLQMVTRGMSLTQSIIDFGDFIAPGLVQIDSHQLSNNKTVPSITDQSGTIWIASLSLIQMLVEEQPSDIEWASKAIKQVYTICNLPLGEIDIGDSDNPLLNYSAWLRAEDVEKYILPFPLEKYIQQKAEEKNQEVNATREFMQSLSLFDTTTMDNSKKSEVIFKILTLVKNNTSSDQTLCEQALALLIAAPENTSSFLDQLIEDTIEFKNAALLKSIAKNPQTSAATILTIVEKLKASFSPQDDGYSSIATSILRNPHTDSHAVRTLFADDDNMVQHYFVQKGGHPPDMIITKKPFAFDQATFDALLQSLPLDIGISLRSISRLRDMFLLGHMAITPENVESIQAFELKKLFAEKPPSEEAITLILHSQNINAIITLLEYTEITPPILKMVLSNSLLDSPYHHDESKKLYESVALATPVTAQNVEFILEFCYRAQKEHRGKQLWRLLSQRAGFDLQQVDFEIEWSFLTPDLVKNILTNNSLSQTTLENFVAATQLSQPEIVTVLLHQPNVTKQMIHLIFAYAHKNNNWNNLTALITDSELPEPILILLSQVYATLPAKVSFALLTKSQLPESALVNIVQNDNSKPRILRILNHPNITTKVLSQMISSNHQEQILSQIATHPLADAEILLKIVNKLDPHNYKVLRELVDSPQVSTSILKNISDKLVGMYDSEVFLLRLRSAASDNNFREIYKELYQKIVNHPQATKELLSYIQNDPRLTATHKSWIREALDNRG
jgi:superfamily II DNA or RNA helicase